MISWLTEEELRAYWALEESARRLFHAWMLAPDVDTAERLLEDEGVEESRLDPVWVARLRRERLRREAA